MILMIVMIVLSAALCVAGWSAFIWASKKPQIPASPPCDHRFRVISCKKHDLYEPGTYKAEGRLPQRRYTNVLQGCGICGYLKVRELEGHWELDDIQIFDKEFLSVYKELP